MARDQNHILYQLTPDVKSNAHIKRKYLISKLLVSLSHLGSNCVSNEKASQKIFPFPQIRQLYLLNTYLNPRDLLSFVGRFRG